MSGCGVVREATELRERRTPNSEATMSLSLSSSVWSSSRSSSSSSLSLQLSLERLRQQKERRRRRRATASVVLTSLLLGAISFSTLRISFTQIGQIQQHEPQQNDSVFLYQEAIVAQTITTIDDNNNNKEQRLESPTEALPTAVSLSSQSTKPKAKKTSQTTSSLALSSTPNVTLTDFVVAGVNLASYESGSNTTTRPTTTNVPLFDLYDTFDLSTMIIGNETWEDLVRYRRDVQNVRLAYYVDKVARKQHWQSKVPVPKSYVLHYAHELSSYTLNDTTIMTTNLQEELLQLLQPYQHLDFVAKPTHLSCSGGVWIKKHAANGTVLVAHGKQPMAMVQDNSNQTTTTTQDMSLLVLQKIATSLAQDLYKQQDKCGKRVLESWGLQQVRPGFVVEERYRAPRVSSDAEDDQEDNKGAGMEFKVFTIWGKMWLAVWRPGMDGVHAMIDPNGITVPWKNEKHSQQLPDWVDWPRIVKMAEQLGAHKDMFRTDIFVGVPATGRANSSEPEEIQYVVSETEFHPTPLRGTESIFAEGGRLWLAGYQIGRYRVVPDAEVPDDFTIKEQPGEGVIEQV